MAQAADVHVPGAEVVIEIVEAGRAAKAEGRRRSGGRAIGGCGHRCGEDLWFGVFECFFGDEICLPGFAAVV